MTDTEVLIVGAGPVGLTAALELRRRGVGCRVVDRLAAPVHYAKAVGVQPRTLELWAAAGIVTRALDAAIPMHGQLIFVDGQQVSRTEPTLPPDVPYGFVALLAHGDFLAGATEEQPRAGPGRTARRAGGTGWWEAGACPAGLRGRAGLRCVVGGRGGRWGRREGRSAGGGAAGCSGTPGCLRRPTPRLRRRCGPAPRLQHLFSAYSAPIQAEATSVDRVAGNSAPGCAP